MYVSTVGGSRVVEPASDLAVTLAVVSSHVDRPPVRGLVAIGEVGPQDGHLRLVPAGDVVALLTKAAGEEDAVVLNTLDSSVKAFMEESGEQILLTGAKRAARARGAPAGLLRRAG